MKDKAIAFDFDGTLVHSGYDKKEFFRSKTRRLVEALLTGHPLSPGEATDAIHAWS